MKIWRAGTSPEEALFAKIMMQDNLIMVFNDIGSSFNLLSDTLYQQLGEPCQIRVCNKKTKAAKNGKMFVKGSTANQVQLQKITLEITVGFLVTKIEIMRCLFGMKFLYNFDCILNPEKTNSIAGKLENYYKYPYHIEVMRIIFKLLQRTTFYLVAAKI